jgi:rhodanese-related sulfurtransferase
LCGKNISTGTVSTIGTQRRFNYALQPMSRERFIEIATAELPDAPAYFTYDAVLNARERPTLERPTLERTLAQELNPLSPEQTLALQRVGAQLLDTREPAQFEGAHLRGSANVGLGGSYASWCGTILDGDRPIVLIAEPGREQEAATRLGRIGSTPSRASWPGGWSHSRRARAGRAHAADHRGLARGATAHRPASETGRRADAGRVQPAPHRWRDHDQYPARALSDRLATLSAGQPTMVYCASWYRSAIAARPMRRSNIAQAIDLVGGLPAWDAARLPTASAPCRRSSSSRSTGSS